MKFAELKTKWWLLPLIIGALIRLVLMPITLHPDLWGHSFTAYFFAYQWQINIYDFLGSLPNDYPLVKNFGVADIFIYPPLSYFTLGIFRLIVRPLTDTNFIPWLMDNLGNVHSYPGLFQHLFLFKLPYLFVDIGIAFLLSNIFDEVKKKKLAFALWMYNPLTIYATFMIGQLDILPVFFTVLSLYFWKKRKLNWALAALGIGASYKMYPVFLIIPAALLISENFKDRIKSAIIGLLPFVLIIAPFVASPSFRSMVLFAPKSQKMLFMGWPVSGAEVIFPFILMLTIIYWVAYYRLKEIKINSYFLIILLLVFSVTHFHPQWFLWITPFLIIELVSNNFKNWFLIATLFVAWLAITLLFESSLSYGLFNPVWPFLEKAPSFSTVISKYTDPFQLKSLIRSVFAGTAFILALRLIFESRSNDSESL